MKIIMSSMTITLFVVRESLCRLRESDHHYTRLGMYRVQRNRDKGVSQIVKFSKTLLGTSDKMAIEIH